MVDIESKLKTAKASVTNTNWEVILTDPSLSKFSFGQHISDKYIMTDIISPLGQKSILYNTVTNNPGKEVCVGLNFEDIDEANVSTLNITGDPAFFENWNVVLRDNRNGKELKLNKPQVVEVTPPIEMNKLKNLGFSEERKEPLKTYFDLHINKIS